MTTPSPKRTPRELTVSAAVAQILKVDDDLSAGIQGALDAAMEKFRDRLTKRVRATRDKRYQRILSRVHPSAVAIVLKEAGHDVPECFEPITDDVPAMTSAEIDEVTAELPRGARPLSPERLAVGKGR